MLTITPNHGNISKLSRTTAAQPSGLKKNQKSAWQTEHGLIDDNNKPLGVYCAFGYHDAISVSVPEEIKDSYSICDNKSQRVTDHVDGTYTIEALSCLFSSTYTEKEKLFWNLEDSFQYRFITVIRIGEDVQKEKIQKVIDNYNSESDVMVYYSIEHC